MIIENVFFKRDAVLHARVPEEIKKAFQDLAKAKDKTASEYVLELVLGELSRERGKAGNQISLIIQNSLAHE